MSHKWAIENSPLQAYASALVFSPAHSPIRGLFEKEKPTWITVKWGVGDEWSACLQTFEGDETANSVAFSHNSAWLASASNDRTIKIWDVSSGDCLRTLKGRSSYVNSVAFSRDSIWLASASGDQTVKIWDASNGHCLRTLSGHSSSVHSVAFSHDSVRLASASNDRTIKIWDVNSGNCLRTLEGHRYWVHSVTFSHNSVRLASASGDQTVKIWDVSSGECLHTLEGHSNVRSVAFSLDSVWLASASDGSTVKIWNASSGDYVKTLKVGKVSIDATSSYLHTEIGTFAIDASMADMILGVTDSQNPQYQYQGWALSSNREWITYNSKNLVWLPSEYRPLCRAVSGKAIGIGVGSGKLWLFSVGLPNLESVCIDNAVVCSWRRHRR
ncbi:MAG: hypothetical protein M1839_000833 [Geoglossum umbratile]|nr:MAG: hypothetical protein M1839_000833 [Geoglossum umbratile]